MPRSEIFRSGIILAISLLATVGGLAAESVWDLNPSTLVIGPLVAICLASNSAPINAA